jgi:metal-responsive CopG/Arc/MetJ family transcriptional regulator
MGYMAEKTQITVRLETSYLQRIEAIGAGIGPKPLNRSEMLNVALREYVERHQPAKAKPEKAKKSTGA